MVSVSWYTGLLKGSRGVLVYTYHLIVRLSSRVYSLIKGFWKLCARSTLFQLTQAHCCSPTYYDADLTRESWRMQIRMLQITRHTGAVDSEGSAALGCLKGVSKSVHVQFNGIEAVMY